ncbi:HAMP domain-containing histidine kinase [Neobacillus mesonae]|uniref:histidine kinase n=1 Tax=Neobacillus mesonae TaxID=1193713 RepID=A0A3Q9QV03_9BACI|nr:HAMP domain-containing histidine kinase [Neobacillus mesonae]AZU62196.1 HAMP domain-containing histidine kinase [Neobacillus mesonae]
MAFNIKWLTSQPIRHKVLVFGLFMSIIPLLLISFYYFYHTKIDLENRIKEKQELILQNLSTEISLEFNLTSQHLQNLTLLSAPSRTDSEFYQLLQQNESIEEIVILDDHGNVEKRISRYKLNKPESHEKWYSKGMWQKHKKNNKAYSDVQINQFGQPVIKLAVPLYENGVTKGAGVVIQLQKIVGKIASFRQDQASYLYLLDSKGKVIAHQDSSKLWQKKSVILTDSVLGVKQQIPGLNWSLVMEEPKTSAFKPIYKMFNDGLIVMALFTIIVSLISIYAGFYFTKPILMLEKAINKMKYSEEFSRLPVERNDEIGKLVESFNEMGIEIQAKKEIEEKMIQTDKLAALGLMASSFAHEVNNPLTVINIYAEDLLDRINGSDPTLDNHELDNYLQKITDNAGRCKKITGNLLNFSRKTNWTVSEIDIKEIIQNTITLVDYSLNKKNIKLISHLSEIPVFPGDSLKLMQVLVNIINNSIDSIEKDGEIAISGELKDNLFCLSISDTGEGISKENLPYIFDPFFTTKTLGKGTGLGLSVCYGIIQQFGGRIQLISNVGKGTTVEIMIPIHIGKKEGSSWGKTES